MMLSLLDIVQRIEAGDVSPQTAIDEARERLNSGDAAIGAIVEAQAAPVAGLNGPLRGIAVGIKDIIDVAGLPTQMGSPIYEGWRPRGDSAIVAALRRAGATPLAKTTTTPFAFLDPTATRNPHNPDHSPGGSSAGSAAAVGGGLLPLAIGTQTGGSVIRPASFCGTAAIKPSFRLLPTVGVKCYSWNLDTLGLFAASVPDLAFALAAITGRDSLRLKADKAETDASGLRIGIVTQDFASAPDASASEALDMAAAQASRAGARFVTPVLPSALADAFLAHGIIQDYEAKQALAWEYDNHRDLLPPLLGKALDEAQNVAAATYDEARRRVREARQALRGVFAECDVLLTYSAPGTAPLGHATTGDSRFNRLWTLMGTPCVNVPGLFSSDGLPVGVQVISAHGADEKALRSAAILERVIREA